MYLYTNLSAEPITIGYSPVFYMTSEQLGTVVLTIVSDTTALWDFTISVSLWDFTIAVSTASSILSAASKFSSFPSHELTTKCGERSVVLLYIVSTALAVPGSDYEELDGEVILFPAGADYVTHTINITQDTLCEIATNPEGDEQFLSVIQSTSGPGTVIVDQHLATVIIDDSSEPECGEYKQCLLGRF